MNFQERIRREDCRGTIHIFIFARAQSSFGTTHCPMRLLWNSPTLLNEGNRGQSWLTRRIENYCKTRNRVDARELYDHCAVDLAYSLVTLHHTCKHRAAAASKHLWKSLRHTCWVCPYWKILKVFYICSRNRVKLTHKGQCLTSALSQHLYPCF